MSLKLFRSTGYSSILVPGETRVAMHPGWVVFATSLWIGFVCNVALWRELLPGGEGGKGLAWAATTGAFTAAASGLVLSLFGWRRTLKTTATLMLALAALAACAMWAQSLPLDASLLDKGPRGLLPVWPSLLRWQVPALLMALGLLPMLWLWHTQLRRLPGPDQLAANSTGMAIGCAVLAVTGWLLWRGF
jgi:glucan phosphoethanolaminetransferase (alkaline phosphatase superfamily)